MREVMSQHKTTLKLTGGGPCYCGYCIIFLHKSSVQELLDSNSCEELSCYLLTLVILVLNLEVLLVLLRPHVTFEAAETSSIYTGNNIVFLCEA